MGSSRSSARAAAFVAACGALASALAFAQAPHATARAAEREVRGAVFRASGRGAAPLAGAWVVLHRVGTDHAGPLDSVRTTSGGRFAFRYRTSGESTAVYFVSSRYRGIAYFTPPLRRPLVQGGDADVLVYDTTSAPVEIRVRGRHVIVTAPDSARTRSVIEVYELSNDTTVTRVAGAAGRPTFEALLPDGARNPEAGGGDVPAAAITFAHGRARVFAPLAPGVKQVSFTYRLPLSGATIVLPSLAAAAVLEVLVEDPRASVSGAGLRETEAAAVERRPFKRFLAQHAPANAVISVTAPSRSGPGSRALSLALIVTAVGATMLLALGYAFLRIGERPSRHATPPR